MNGLLSTRAIIGICIALWAIIVVRGMMSTKDESDFAFTVSQQAVEGFAKSQLAAVQRRSIAEDQELCAIIFEDSNGELGTTPLVAGQKASCDITFFDEPGMGPVASFHTHAAHDPDYDSEAPSVLDMESDIEGGMDGYISTPGGRLWRINAVSEDAIQICGENCLPQDPAYAPCPRFEPAKRYSLDELRARQSGDNGQC